VEVAGTTFTVRDEGHSVKLQAFREYRMGTIWKEDRGWLIQISRTVWWKSLGGSAEIGLTFN
jgi:hypothetical protein